MARPVKNSFIYLSARLAMGAIRRMSLKASLRLGRALGRRAYSLARRDRELALRHLAQAFPEKTEEERAALALATFEHFGMALAECVNVRKIGDVTAYMKFGPGSRQVLSEALAGKRGVIFVSAHCGNWELMARSMALGGFPINTIGRRSYDARFTRLIDDFREQGRVHTIWRGDPGVSEKMLSVLQKGEVLGLLVDQDTKVPGAFVPFFGKPAWTPTAPAMLARKTGAAVVTGFNHRVAEGGGRIVVEHCALQSIRDSEQAILEDTTRLNLRIESHIRAHPTEWVWMHRRWRTRPTGR